MEGMKPLVVVTGITGYLGSHVCHELLKDGRYKVRGTVRSVDNQEKLKPIKDAFGDLYNELDIVEADLLNKQSLIDACEGASYVIHTASPFPVKPPKNEMDLIQPAVDGTLAVCEGAKRNNVIRLIITSSIVSISVKNQFQERFTPDDWSDIAATVGYSKSKTLAEKAAWDFQKALPEKERFEMTVICPGLILGRPLIQCNFSSADIIKMILNGSVPRVPPIQMGLVDVVDCAQAHIRAIDNPEAANKRFILTENSYFFMTMSKWLKAKYPENKKICTKPLGCLCLIKCFACCNSQAAYLVRQWGKNCIFDNSATKSVLGIQFKPMEQSTLEMAEFLINSGYVDKK